jgi:hypothetical protein
MTETSMQQDHGRTGSVSGIPKSEIQSHLRLFQEPDHSAPGKMYGPPLS